MTDTCDFCMVNPRECTFSVFILCASCFQYYLEEDENDYDSDFDSDVASDAETVIVN